MRVLYLTNNPNRGGTVRILQSWFLYARTCGITPVVAVTPGSKFAGWLRDNDVEFIENPMPLPSNTKPWESVWHAARLALWARSHRVDLIHCNEHDVYRFASVVRGFLRVPIVCHIRFTISHPLAKWLFAGARRPDFLLWTSNTQKSDCADGIGEFVSEDRQAVVRLGFDLSWFGTRIHERGAIRRGWGLTPEQVAIGQCTALRPRKRIEDFIDVVAGVAARHQHVVGILAGDAPPGDETYRAAVLRRIAASDLGSRFRWLGNIEDVEPFCQGIDIFVSTSEYETFGNSVCEAMACGRPVVAYEGGSVKEVVGNSGSIVPTGDCAALIAATEHLVAEPGRLHELGEAARERVRTEFDPRRSFEQLLDVYSRCTEVGR